MKTQSVVCCILEENIIKLIFFTYNLNIAIPAKINCLLLKVRIPHHLHKSNCKLDNFAAFPSRNQSASPFNRECNNRDFLGREFGIYPLLLPGIDILDIPPLVPGEASRGWKVVLPNLGCAKFSKLSSY